MAERDRRRRALGADDVTVAQQSAMANRWDSAGSYPGRAAFGSKGSDHSSGASPIPAAHRDAGPPLIGRMRPAAGTAH